MALVDRARNIIVQPNQEWPIIAAETTTPGALFQGYIVPLALIGPVCSFIGSAFVRHRPFIAVAVGAVMAFVLALVGVYVIALIAQALAPSFNGVKNREQALKLVAYANTPAWVAGVLNLLPLLGILAIIAGLYGLYLLYLGVKPVMGVPEDKALGYTVVVVLTAIVVYVLIGTAVGVVLGVLAAGAILSSGALIH